MAVTYNQVYKTATITSKQISEAPMPDFPTGERLGSMAVAQFDAKRTIEMAYMGRTMMMPFHAIDNVVVTQTTQETAKTDPVCGFDPESCSTIYDGNVEIPQNPYAQSNSGVVHAEFDYPTLPATLMVTFNGRTGQANKTSATETTTTYTFDLYTLFFNSTVSSQTNANVTISVPKTIAGTYDLRILNCN